MQGRDGEQRLALGGISGARSWLRFAMGLLQAPQAGSHYGEQETPPLPFGEHVEVPGQGRTWVRTSDGPADTCPVVLLHGWTWDADLNFAGVYPLLVDHHRLIAPDVLGHGRTARARGRWRLEDATDGVIALLNQLGIDRAIVCGFSMGGVMAVDAALRYPDRVAGVVIQASAACYTTTTRNRCIWRILALLWPIAHQWDLTRITARGYADSLHRGAVLQKRWDWAQDELARMTLADVLTVADQVRRADLRPQLRAPLRCPAESTVLIHDRLCQPALQRDLAVRVGAVQTDVPGDHDLPVVDPDAYGELTAAAILRVARRARQASSSTR